MDISRSPLLVKDLRWKPGKQQFIVNRLRVIFYPISQGLISIAASDEINPA
jgi:hypothetical protein